MDISAKQVKDLGKILVLQKAEIWMKIHNEDFRKICKKEDLVKILVG